MTQQETSEFPIVPESQSAIQHDEKRKEFFESAQYTRCNNV
jgi:hypothetical protein